MSLRVEINEDDYKRVIKAIKPLERSEESVLKTAVNNTAKRAQKHLIATASKRYAGGAGKQAALKEQSSIDKANTSKVASVIYFSSEMQEISDFHVSSMKISKAVITKRKKRSQRHIKGNVLRGTSKSLGNAFVVKFHSGHVAVVRRVDGENMKKYSGKPVIPHYAKLEKLLSPNVPEMIGNKNVYDPDELSDFLNDEIDKVMTKVLGG